MKGKHSKHSGTTNGFFEKIKGVFSRNKAENGEKMVRLKGDKVPMSKKKKIILSIVISLAAIALALVIVAVSVATSYLNQVSRLSDLSGDIGVNSDLPTDGVQNIALFGIDSRNNDESGRSDAMIILSIDRVHNKIKMTSIARDSLVQFDNYQSKLTHAFGWGGYALAVKTINKNYGLNITDFAYVNFHEFAGIIDYIGGVNIDVSASEMQVMNNKYTKYIREMGIDCPDITQTGMQRLNGGQALAYSRNRYTGNDIERNNRQKEVLEAMFAEVKDVPLTKFPSLISKVMELCHTNMTNSELLSVATWALTKQPTTEQISIPTKELNAIGGIYDRYGWVYRYDMKQAAQVIYEFIYEPETESETTDDTATPAE